LQAFAVTGIRTTAKGIPQLVFLLMPTNGYLMPVSQGK
jgi:hypothetical protein